MSERARRFFAFWRANGTAAIVRLVRTKLAAMVAGEPVLNEIRPQSKLSADVTELMLRRFPNIQPLPTCLAPRPKLGRVSLVTDSIGKGSLFGGVGTALIFAAQVANRTSSTLRIVVRTEAPASKNVAQVLDAYAIKLNHEIQFSFVPVGKSEGFSASEAAEKSLDIFPDELFITTSWWTTAAALPSVPRASIFYLLQEDERMFYPFGEERAQCERVLRTQDIRFIVNTRLLYEHLIDSGLEHLRENGRWFEPAFPRSLFHERTRVSGGRKRFFFYARPNNPRNLFLLGLAVIDRAVNEGVLDLDQWEVLLVGKDIPGVTLGDGNNPQRCEELDWQAYADLVGTIDLGLSLMYTPHPSYPPLDLAASGAVVVTNKFGNKQDLFDYSRNIICADLDVESLVQALREGVALANAMETRRRNYSASALGTDWSLAFDETFDLFTSSV